MIAAGCLLVRYLPVRHGWGLAIFPLAAAVVAGVFSGQLAVRCLQKLRPHEAVWSLALAMYAVASFAMFLGVMGGWNTLEFLVYWLLGAVLNVPYLFVGEVYLLTRRRQIGHAVLAVVAALSVLAGVIVFRAQTCGLELQQALPLGRKVFLEGTPNLLAQLYAIPAYFLLLSGLVWSAWQMKGRPELRGRAAGVFGIALGATIVAIGSGIGAAFHVVPLFSIALAVGVAVMFVGFLTASAPGSRATGAAAPHTV